VYCELKKVKNHCSRGTKVLNVYVLEKTKSGIPSVMALDSMLAGIDTTGY